MSWASRYIEKYISGQIRGYEWLKFCVKLCRTDPTAIDVLIDHVTSNEPENLSMLLDLIATHL